MRKFIYYSVMILLGTAILLVIKAIIIPQFVGGILATLFLIWFFDQLPTLNERE